MEIYRSGRFPRKNRTFHSRPRKFRRKGEVTGVSGDTVRACLTFSRGIAPDSWTGTVGQIWECPETNDDLRGPDRSGSKAKMGRGSVRCKLQFRKWLWQRQNVRREKLDAINFEGDFIIVFGVNLNLLLVFSNNTYYFNEDIPRFVGN